MDAVRTIIKEAPRFMNPRGLLVVEVGHSRAAAEAAFPRLPFLWLQTEGSEDSVFALWREELIAGR
jgi:ribosomal protein L3 glutamine methyltransferase